MPNILIIEDDKITAEGISSILDNEGYQVDIAQNGKIAFDRLKDKSYNIIITDLMMPEMDGIQFINRLRMADNETPVIVVTAYGNIENMLAAFELGAVEIMEKPFDIEEFIHLVNELTK
ncbi:MAG: response regulator [Flexistipes sinusarabici]|uniref:Response regulator n=1 Tax=Flexistipes sinusarabici TaxID=2352 RepID=A0A5D0MKF3_FLESI|nr:response regulator [Flexistipes sinusarabici]TYB32882.1 MAG: response regulator [Flexistipes sinusarabici]